MAINFENALGIHEDAMRFRAKRASILANNLANVDTPNYKARDMDFKTALDNKMNAHGKPLELATTHNSHREAKGLLEDDGGLLYRTPEQPAIDGNTVEEHVEHAKFMENSLDFQTSFTLLNSKFKGLKTALRGE
ncbi:MAG: flagellar basal body rod protein FlgB [Candidatus Pelagadaptatus aseana]|uniref:flagellar basal body rod protein FlgB n=1 Tax=Candidatus Pelagadaptatus aseana TaxID=3120508 RepID=UPI0039B2B414